MHYYPKKKKYFCLFTIIYYLLKFEIKYFIYFKNSDDRIFLIKNFLFSFQKIKSPV